MKQTGAAPFPFGTLGLRITMFGHIAAAMVRALLRLERAGSPAAAKQAALIETWLWWALLGFTRELEALSDSKGMRTPEEAEALSRTACLLSILFTLILMVRGVRLRCAGHPGAIRRPCPGYLRLHAAAANTLAAPGAACPRRLV